MARVKSPTTLLNRCPMPYFSRLDRKINLASELKFS
jgi:hypothetical protein